MTGSLDETYFVHAVDSAIFVSDKDVTNIELLL